MRGPAGRDLARDLPDRGDHGVEVLLHPVVGAVHEGKGTSRDGEGVTLVVEQGGLHNGGPGVDAEPGAGHDRLGSVLLGTVCP
jgi:hypothetical protein